MSCIKLLSLSLLMTFAVFLYALRDQEYYYPALVFMRNSSLCMTVIYFQLFVFVYVIGVSVKMFFLGPLAQHESDALAEHSWHMWFEECIAFSENENRPHHFFVSFTVLLLLNVLNFLAKIRVDSLKRSPLRFSNLKMILFLALLGAVETKMIILFFSRRGMIFCLKYSHLLLSLIKTFIKHNQVDGNNERRISFMYADFLISSLESFASFSYIVTSLYFHEFPLHAFFDFNERTLRMCDIAGNIVRAKKALRNLKSFPNATAADLKRDAICPICREEMLEHDESKKLPCRHIFHAYCLGSWFQEQQTCPTCRYDVLSNFFKLVKKQRIKIKKLKRTRRRNELNKVEQELSKSVILKLKDLKDAIEKTQSNLEDLSRFYTALYDSITEENSTKDTETQTEMQK